MTKFLLPMIAAAAVMIPMSNAEARGSRDRHHHRYDRKHHRHHHYDHGYRRYSRRPVVVYRDYYPGSYYRPYHSYGYGPRVYRRPGLSFFFGL